MWGLGGGWLQAVIGLAAVAKVVRQLTADDLAGVAGRVNDTSHSTRWQAGTQPTQQLVQEALNTLY
jgi:hypothetical protein